MRVLIIGGLGFLGQHLTTFLKSEGYYVAAVDNLSQATSTWAIANETIFCDAHNLTSIRGKWDYIIHAASPAGPARIKPGYALREIIDLTTEGLELAKRTDARFIKFSTSEVYNRADTALSELTSCLVGPLIDARSEYQVGFLGAETACFTSAHKEVQVLRLFNVVGPKQSIEAGVVIPRFCYQALTGKPLTVFGGGGQRRAFLDVDDFVHFVHRLMVSWPSGKAIWNVGNPGNTISIKELATEVAQQAAKYGVYPKIEFTDGRVLTPYYRDGIEKADVVIDKARALGWEPKIRIGQIVGRCLTEMKLRVE